MKLNGAEGFKVKVFPEAGELAAARASGENPARSLSLADLP